MRKRLVAVFLTLCTMFCQLASARACNDLAEGIAEYNSKNYMNSIRKLTEAISNDQNNREAYLFRGHAYGEIGDFEKAILDYKKAMEIAPENSDVYFYLGIVYGEKHDYETAISYYSKAIQHNGLYVDAITNRGWMYLALLKYPMAEHDFRLALDLSPENTHVLSGMAEFYGRQNSFTSALSLYNKAIDVDANDPKLYYFRGVLLEKNKKYREAIHDFSKAISINPKYLDAYLERGNCLAETGERKMAIDDFTRAIQLDNNNTTAYNNRAYTYYELGLFTESMGDYNKAIKISDSNADLYYGRSELFAKMNKHREALRDAKTAIELSPDNNKYREWHNKLTTITEVPKIKAR
jgi:tetratricopeptide (TPR) repeat protein